MNGQCDDTSHQGIEEELEHNSMDVIKKKQKLSMDVED